MLDDVAPMDEVNLVAVGISQVGAIVAVAVVGPGTRGAFIGAAGGKPGGMRLPHRFCIGARNATMLPLPTVAGLRSNGE